MIQALVLGLALFSSSPISEGVSSRPLPAMNLDSIHPIYCDDPIQGIYMGTGFMIAGKTIATAYHVAGTRCMDTKTGKLLTTYKTDKAHDFALMTESVYQYGGYLHYNCSKPIEGETYLSYGYSSMDLDDFFHPILRNNAIQATGVLVRGQDEVKGSTSPELMRMYNWAGVQGTSGGPVTDVFGNIVAINNAGTNEISVDYDLADTGLCTGKWDK